MSNPLRDAIIARAEQPAALAPIEAKGWEGCFIREMNAAERDAYEQSQFEASKQGKALDNFRAKLLTRVVVDGEGNRIFDHTDADRVGALGAREIRKVFDQAAKINALTVEDQDDLAKNS